MKIQGVVFVSETERNNIGIFIPENAKTAARCTLNNRYNFRYIFYLFVFSVHLLFLYIAFKKILLGFHVGWGERSEPQLNQDVGVHSVHPSLPKIIILNTKFPSWGSMPMALI